MLNKQNTFPIMHLVGISDDVFDNEIAEIFNKAQVVYGSKKIIEKATHLYASKEFSAPVFPITPVENFLHDVDEISRNKRVVVFVSGDPLFFGIGQKLIEKIGKDRVIIHPSVSFMQLAFARIKLNWDDACLCSVHGRDLSILAKKVEQHNKLFLFTDPVNNPIKIANYLTENIASEICNKICFHVVSSLGRADEQIFSGNIHQLLEKKCFDQPNVMIIEQAEGELAKQHITKFGLKENEIKHSRGLITKDEIRSVALHKLDLPQNGVLWDVGAGSGSMSIEAGNIFNELTIFSIEKNEQQQQNITENIRRFGRDNIVLVNGIAPEALSQIPAPDRIFVGGSGGNLREILIYCCNMLKENGVIVVNCVLRKNFDIAPEILHEQGLHVEISTIAVTRQTYPQAAQEFNPIHIITGRK